MLPRGLITVVLAVQVLEAKGEHVAFLSELAFAVILVTNLMAIIASIRAKPSTALAKAAYTCHEEGHRSASTDGSVAGTEVRVRHWRWNALLLMALALGGLLLWYGKHEPGSRGKALQTWISQHVRR
jgi:hypothetical protein